MTGLGTVAWSAPEVLTHEAKENPFAGDVWSFGVVGRRVLRKKMHQ